jgi:hypothetical protein
MPSRAGVKTVTIAALTKFVPYIAPLCAGRWVYVFGPDNEDGSNDTFVILDDYEVMEQFLELDNGDFEFELEEDGTFYIHAL